MRITVTPAGEKMGIAWPSIKPFELHTTEMSMLAFCVVRGFATAEPENDTERVCFDAALHEVRHYGTRP